MSSCINSHDGLNDSLDQTIMTTTWTGITSSGEGCIGRGSKQCRVDDNSEYIAVSTIVTNNGHEEDEFDSEVESNDDVDDVRDNLSYNDVPAEVKVSQVDEDDNEDSDSEIDSCSSSSEEDMNDDDAIDDESDEESVDSECSDSDIDDDVTTESCSSSSPKIKCVRESSTPPHRLFLPADTSPTYEELKYDDDEEESDDEEEPTPLYSQRTYMMGNNRGLRPRMMLPTHHHRLWNRNLSSISWSASPSTESSSISSSPSQSSSSTTSSCRNEKSRRAGVSFNDSVTVYPVFPSKVYSADMICQMYTKRDELRANKLRNKREFAYDLQDWRNATEESDMDENDDGVFVHPVHDSAEPTRKRPNTSNSPPLGGYQVGSATVVHRAKRMRMFYP